eukprot:5774724-Alexandrium_andersonii.AAC.1
MHAPAPFAAEPAPATAAAPPAPEVTDVEPNTQVVREVLYANAEVGTASVYRIDDSDEEMRDAE